MIQIQLKAKHFYYIANYLRNASVEQYYPLISRMKLVLKGSTDYEQLYIVYATSDEVISIYRILTLLPEGQASSFNEAMGILLQQQIVNGVATEQAGGIVPDADGNLPANAYWQYIALGLQDIQTNNTTARTEAISRGKQLIEQ